MSFPWPRKRADEKSSAELVQSFEKEIERHEDLLYGVALVFEGISLLNAGQDAIVGTYRKQFRNIIQSGRNISQQAADLLKEVKQDPDKAPLLAQFNLTLCEGHPDTEGMLKRAEVMVKTYHEIFPNRPKSKPFTEEETFRLMEEAGEELAKLRK
jgi:hypothetical protein